jgi:hypothetical protein
MVMSEGHAIEERDGERVLVNENGERVICRRATGRSVRHIYHRIDLVAVADGTIQPACQCSGYDDGNWLTKPRNTLNDAWSGCDYQACFGDKPRAVTGPPSSQYTLLTEMSVEEFEQASGKTGD